MKTQVSLNDLATSILSSEINEALEVIEIYQVKPVKPVFYVISNGRKTYFYLQGTLPNKRLLTLLALVLGVGGIGWLADLLKLL